VTVPAIPTTSVPSALAYLLSATTEQVKFDAAASSILIGFTDPGFGPDVPNEFIQFGEVKRLETPTTFQGGGGQFWLNEVYDIACLVSVWTGSSDSDGATDVQVEQIARVWQLYSYVETAIRLDPSLGDLVDQANPQDTVQSVPEWTQEALGLLVEINFTVHVSKLN
jgi:hypothetical protein